MYGKVISSLAKCNINRPDENILRRISKSDSLLRHASTSTDYAYNLYDELKITVQTPTQTYIGEIVGLNVDGPLDMDMGILNVFKASDINTGQLKVMKILRVPEGTKDYSIRKKDIEYEVYAANNFKHDAIVPMTHHRVELDTYWMKILRTNINLNEVLVMPLFSASLNSTPSNMSSAIISRQGFRILDALEYIHGCSYVHLDVKAMNIFVNGNGDWFLGDFGSCKPINELITSSSEQFYFKDIVFKSTLADPIIDWFMFLVLLMIETLVDRNDYENVFKVGDPTHVNYDLVVDFAKNKISTDEIIAPLINNLFIKLNIMN